MKLKVEITLLSDTCIASGTTEGSNIDMDVYTDDFGFPYIPSKRIKGLYRDAYINVSNMGIKLTNSLDDLFGNTKKEGKLKFSNAILTDRLNARVDDLDIKKSDEKNFRRINKSNKERVKRVFVSKRTQTKIDDESEVAVDGSLRTIYVVNKGLKFHLIISCDDLQNIIDDITILNKYIRHMGLNRNRGLGLVDFKIVKNDIKVEKNNNPLIDFASDDEIVVTIKYHNINPLLISQNYTNESINYIPGQAIYGFFGSLKAKENKDFDISKNPLFKAIFIEGKVEFSNAYPYVCDSLSIPVPKYLKKVKNNGNIVNLNSFDNELNKALNKTIGEKRQDKVSSLDNSFISLNHLLKNEALIIKPDYEYSYHHQRNDEGLVDSFYQYYALVKDQDFIGTIKGKKSLIEYLLNYNNEIIKEAYFGKSKNSQYGKTSLEIISCNKINENNNLNPNYYALVFTSDIIITKNGNPINNIDDLIMYLNDYGFEVLNNNYAISFKEITGYNMLWQLPKQKELAIEKGSYLIVKTLKEVKQAGTFGKFTNLGYGNYILLDNFLEKVEKRELDKNEQELIFAENTYFYEAYNKEKIIDDINKDVLDIITTKDLKLSNSLIGRLYNLVIASNSFEEYYNALIHIKSVREKSDGELSDFIEKHVKNLSNDYLKYYKYYFKTLLKQFEAKNSNLGGDKNA